jgi:hypothetical protein
MAVTNLLKTKVDQPVYEWCRFAPFAASALTAFVNDENGSDRYIYAISGTAFWRYDTISDSWQELSSAPVAGVVVSAMHYDPAAGAIGEVISAGASTLTVGGILSNALAGLTVRIVGGRGAGQSRTITSANNPVTFASFNTSSSSVTSMADSTKKWKFNQWKGYSVRIQFNTNAGNVRKILYNDATTITFSDGNYLPYTWQTPLISTPVNVGTIGVIESVTLNLSSPWTIIPDSTSKFQIQGGLIWLFSSAASASGVWNQVYDIITDTWYQKSAIGSSFNGSYNTDIAVDHPIETDAIWEANSSISSATSRTVTNSSANMITDSYVNFILKIVSGPGAGQTERIVANNATTFWTANNWLVNPTTASTYSVLPDFDKIWMIGNASSYMYQYSIESDMWATGAITDWGVARSAHVQAAIPTAVVTAASGNGTTVTYTANNNFTPGQTVSISGLSSLNLSNQTITTASPTQFTVTNATSGTVSAQTGTATIQNFVNTQNAIAVSSIVRSTNGVLTMAVNVGGTGYTVGDLVSLTSGGSSAQAFVTSVDLTTGAVTGLERAASGSGYSAGSSITTGGTGTGLTITITVGTTALVTTAINHGYVTGQSVTMAGFATDTTFNGTFTISGAGLSTFSIDCPASSASPTIALPQSTTTLTDTTKNWAINELVGKVLYGNTSSTNPSNSISRRILSNTSNTITFATATALTSGTGRYIIQEPNNFGQVTTSFLPGQGNAGWVTSPTASGFFDSSKSWLRNQWINNRVRVISGSGVGVESTITSNSASGLFFTSATITSASGNGTTITYNAANTFASGHVVSVTGLPVSSGASLNLLNLTVASGTPTQFFVTNSANGSSVGPTGIATIQLDNTSKYEILDSCGVCTSSNVASTVTDANKNWPVNQLAGKRIKFMAGAGMNGTDYSITSNTATTLTTSGGQSTDTTTQYSISDMPVKATGLIFYWLGGLSDSAQKGRKFIVFRGGASSLYDIYDITTNKWELAPALIPNIQTTFTTGTMSCYDDGDVIYITKDATGRVYKFNYIDKTLIPSSTTPYAHSTATIGNRMSIIKTEDGLKYLYIMRHSGQELWRTLVFW